MQGLDLAGCEIARNLAFFACRFADPPLLRDARLQNLYLNVSVLPGLNANRLQTRGGVFLRSAEVTGEVRLLGAWIGAGPGPALALAKRASSRNTSLSRVDSE